MRTKENATILTPPSTKFALRQPKKGVQEFRKNFVLALADKAANNAVALHPHPEAAAW